MLWNLSIALTPVSNEMQESAKSTRIKKSDINFRPWALIKKFSTRMHDIYITLFCVKTILETSQMSSANIYSLWKSKKCKNNSRLISPFLLCIGKLLLLVGLLLENGLSNQLSTQFSKVIFIKYKLSPIHEFLFCYNFCNQWCF